MRPRTAAIPVDPEQSFLHLDMRASDTAILVGSMVSAVRQPEITIGIATCNGSAWTQMPLVFHTLSSTQSVIGEDGTIATLV